VRALGEVLRLSTAHLERHGSPTARLDAELLLGHALGLGRVELYTGFERPLGEDELAECRELIARRAKREPVAYILGRWGFRGLDLDVDRRVLVPRPETEVVIERCLARIAGLGGPRVLDVGTGSGAIALAIADEHRGARVTGVDASPGALEVAGANVVRTGLAIELREWDLFTGLPDGPWDLVVSNPPYVLPEELGSLEPEVRDWEPRLALAAVGATEAVVRGALDVLATSGALVLEVAAGDSSRVEALLGRLGYEDVRTTMDLAGRDRVVEGTRA
jgi:release factor glutamine methyltransferase